MALSAADRETLSDEITIDPLTRGYSGMSDQGVADDLNTAYRPQDRSIGALQEYCFNTAHNPSLGVRVTTSIWRLCKDLAEGLTITATAPTQQAIDAGWALVRLLDRPPDSTWDLTDANLDTLLSRLVTADAMAEADRTAIKALSESRITRGQELGLGDVPVGWVTEVRSG